MSCVYNCIVDNLVEGKRKRETKTDTPQSATPSTSKSLKDGAKDSTVTQESSRRKLKPAQAGGQGSTAKKPVSTGGKRGSKRRIFALEPTAASTPTPKRKMKWSTEGVYVSPV